MTILPYMSSEKHFDLVISVPEFREFLIFFFTKNVHKNVTLRQIRYKVNLAVYDLN